MKGLKVDRPLSQFKESCGNCSFWNPVPPSDPIFTLRECYKYYEGDAFMDNAKSFDPKPQAEVLISLAMTPAHFKCAKHKSIQENQDGSYESDYEVPEANKRFKEKQAQDKYHAYLGKGRAAGTSGKGNEENSDEGKAENKKEAQLSEDDGIISPDFPPS